MPKDKNKGINPIIAGVAGAVVGAGLAAGANKALKNPKVKKRADGLIDRAKDFADDASQRARDMADKAGERFSAETPKVKKKAKTALKQASKKTVRK